MPINVAYPRDRQKWDRYNRFYVEHSMGIIQFDTGELIATFRQFHPEGRGIGSEFGLMFYYPHDVSSYLRHMQTPEGEPVRQSWLAPGQCLMLDTTSGQVVALHPSNSRCVSDDVAIPDSLIRHGVYAYCRGPKAPWVSTSHIRYARPARLTKADRKHLKDSLLLVKSQARVGAIPSEPAAIRSAGREVAGDARWYGPVDYTHVLGIDVTALHPYNRAVLAFHGYAPFRDYCRITEAKVVV